MMKSDVSESFRQFDDTARLWIFPLAQNISLAQQEEIQSTLSSFVGQWKAHGKAVAGDMVVIEQRFVVLVADPQISEVSGCSIDSMFRTVRSAVQSAGAELADFSSVFFRNPDGTIACLSREEFHLRREQGAIPDETPVFDNSLVSLDRWRQGRWEIPVSQSWHADL
jgi:hypothetical protein